MKKPKRDDSDRNGMIPVRTGLIPDEKALIPVRMGLIPDEKALIPVRTGLIPDVLGWFRTFWDDSGLFGMIPILGCVVWRRNHL